MKIFHKTITVCFYMFLLSALLHPNISAAEQRFAVKNSSNTTTFAIEDNGWLAIGKETPTVALDVSSENQEMGMLTRTTAGPARFGVNSGSNSGMGYYIGGSLKWSSAIYKPSGSNYSFTMYNDQNRTASLFIDGDTNNTALGFTSATLPDFNYRLEINGNGYAYQGRWIDGSSRDFKENIEDLTDTEALLAFENLKPVTFNYKANPDDLAVGFIAEDVPELVAMPSRKSFTLQKLLLYSPLFWLKPEQN